MAVMQATLAAFSKAFNPNYRQAASGLTSRVCAVLGAQWWVMNEGKDKNYLSGRFFLEPELKKKLRFNFFFFPFGILKIPIYQLCDKKPHDAHLMHSLVLFFLY